MTLTNFLDQWAKDAIEAVTPLETSPWKREEAATAQTTTIQWCPVCETRERRKAFSPYCSQICLEAAQRKELMDRR